MCSPELVRSPNSAIVAGKAGIKNDEADPVARLLSLQQPFIKHLTRLMMMIHSNPLD